MITSAEHFNKAIALWFDITGFDPDAKSFTMGKWELRSMNEELKESMEYDPTFVTTYLLLDTFSTGYFKDAKVSIHEFDQDPEAILEYMKKVKEFKALIRSPEIEEAALAFFDSVRKALTHYGISAERIEKFLSDRDNLAIIRRDALLSFKRLRSDHFLQGEVEPADYRPIYNKEVFGYWNINSMIEHACGMPSGIALNLIRDPDELHSYFTISIRNGGNVIMLTDVPEYAHPLGRSMSRRPDREYSARVVKNWFPYQLLNIKYNENGDPFHDVYRESKEKGLVPHQPSHFVISKVVDLDIAQIAWLTLMFDLIHDRYWKKPIPQKALSYTNEMIRLKDRGSLIGRAAGTNLPVVGYQPLDLEILTPADVMTDALDEAAVGKPYGVLGERFGSRRWMEERYGELVPSEALNAIGIPDGSQLFLSSDDATYKPKWGKETSAVVPFEGQIKRAFTKEWLSYGQTALSHMELGNSRAYGMEIVDATLFGTREQLDADRKFIARKNFARAIQREADAEFERERGRVMAWFKKKVIANIDNLLPYAHFDEVEHVRDRICTFGSPHTGGKDDGKLERYDFVRCHDLTRKLEKYEYGHGGHDANLCFDGGIHHAPYYHHCYITDARSSFKLAITPGSAHDLALITDTAFEDLPVYLQHWNPGDEPYTGNPILDRIDPFEWALDSPWNQVSFGIDIYLSKRGRAQLIKNTARPTITDYSGIYNVGITRMGGTRRSQVYHNNWRTDEYIKEAKHD